MQKLLLINLLFFTANLLSQEDRKLVSGKLKDQIQELSGAHIINLNTNVATYSLDDGNFKIYAKKNDSLQFSFIGYKTLILKLKEEHFGILDIFVELQKETIELDEIELKNHNLTGSLTSDVQQVKHRELINASTLKLPNADRRKLTQAERRFYTATSGNLNLLLNLLNGKVKEVKEEIRAERESRYITNVKEKYENQIINILKIDSTEVNHFIYFCYLAEDFNNSIKKGDIYFVNFLQDQAKIYKAIKNE